LTNPAVERPTEDITLGASFSLEELVKREALGEMAESFHRLFALPLRVYGETGTMLADTSQPVALFRYLEGSREGRSVVGEMVERVKAAQPGAGESKLLTCISGARYHIVAVTYDKRAIGRVILGPFREPGEAMIPGDVLRRVPSLDAAKAQQLLRELPAHSEASVIAIAEHLCRSLDLILFSSHRALLTSNMHMASIRESYRELEEKTAKLQRAYDRLRELDRLKSNFLATVSHELRTPLTSIIGYSEMLTAGIAGEITGEQAEFVETIRTKGEQLLELIKGLLDLSKLESGTMSLHKGELDLRKLLEDVITTHAPTAKKKGLELSASLPASLPSVWGDGTRLRQVFLNLVDNAIKFTPAGGSVRLIAQEATLGGAEDGSDDLGPALLFKATGRRAVQVKVLDSGVGIAPEEREKVFDSFYQVDSSSTREQGGAGLGLSIVKRLVDGHDGTIVIEGNEPCGTCFVVTLPCKPAVG